MALSGSGAQPHPCLYEGVRDCSFRFLLGVDEQTGERGRIALGSMDCSHHWDQPVCQTSVLILGALFQRTEIRNKPMNQSTLSLF